MPAILRLLPTLLCLPVVLSAEDAIPVLSPTPVAAAAAAPPAVAAAPVVVPAADPTGWTLSGRLGAWIANVATSNAEDSRDTSIATTTASSSYLFLYEGQANWKAEQDSIDNLFKLRYGRIRTAGQAWQENNDELRYDGVFRRGMGKPHFLYLGWGVESVFTGPDPQRYAFDPTTGKASGGYGQRYDDFLPDQNHIEFRLGVRAQQQWGPSVPPESGSIETGFEAFVRYEQKLKRGGGDHDVRFFAQYEGFDEFNDLAHVTYLVTAGLTVQLIRYLAVELGLRAYYETRPKHDDGTGTGYGSWSLRQDALFGLTYTY